MADAGRAASKAAAASGPVLGVEVGVGTQVDGRVVAKDVGGDGRVDALTRQVKA